MHYVTSSKLFTDARCINGEVAVAAIIDLRVDDFNGEIAVHGVAGILFATLAARSLENGEVAVRVLCFEACRQADSDLPCEVRAQIGARERRNRRGPPPEGREWPLNGETAV